MVVFASLPLQVSLLPPTLEHLWFTDVTTLDLNPDVGQNPDAGQHQNLGQTLASRLPRLLTLVLRCAGPGGQPTVDTADLAAIAAGVTCVTYGCHLSSPRLCM